MKVYLCGGEGWGWALDEDLRLLKEAISPIVQFSSLEECEVIHAVWWEGLRKIPEHTLNKKYVICNLPNYPYFYFSKKDYSKFQTKIDLNIVRSTEALNIMNRLKLNTAYVPYCFDKNIFKSTANNDEKRKIRTKLGIPENDYIIANFHRDTEGVDLVSPKLQKGPDIFLSIVTELSKLDISICVLLAGPRRYWLRRELKKNNINTKFIGEDIKSGQDDNRVNILPREKLNYLYQVSDLCLVSSRWEGGPQSIMEAIGAGCPVLSTKVGLADDICPKNWIFEDTTEAIDKIQEDWQTRFMVKEFEKVQRNLINNHSLGASAEKYSEIYSNINFKKNPRIKPNSVDKKIFASASELDTYCLTNEIHENVVIIENKPKAKQLKPYLLDAGICLVFYNKKSILLRPPKLFSNRYIYIQLNGFIFHLLSKIAILKLIPAIVICDENTEMSVCMNHVKMGCIPLVKRNSLAHEYFGYAAIIYNEKNDIYEKVAKIYKCMRGIGKTYWPNRWSN